MGQPLGGHVGQSELALDQGIAREFFRRRGLVAAVQVLATTTSTQDVAHALAASGAPAGTAVLSGYQETGRGRLGRTWSAPPGKALTMSVVLRPSGAPERQTRIPMVAGLAALDALAALAVRHLEADGEPALARALGSSGSRSALKWPNDVMLRGPEHEWRKAGGILVESRGDGEAVIAGIGLNVYQTGLELPPGATSLLDSGWLDEVAGHSKTDDSAGAVSARFVIEALAAEMTWALLERTARLEVGEEPVGEYRTRLITLAHYVYATQADGSSIAGIAVDVAADGALVVMDAWGRLRAIHAGDVTLSPPVEGPPGHLDT